MDRGSGLRGWGCEAREIGAAELGDLSEIHEGRLVVQVRGRDARLVPIRADWTDTARQAATLAQQRAEPCDGFIRSQDRNAAARAANRIRIGDMSLSLRRARSTWLTAHLEAGTPLPVLREVAGPLSAATLDDLLTATGHSITPEQAATKGCGHRLPRCAHPSPSLCHVSVLAVRGIVTPQSGQPQYS